MTRALLALLVLLAAPLAFAEQLPKLPIAPYYLKVALGEIKGESFIEKFGENSDIDSGGTFEDIWDGGGTYVNPTAASLHDVVSSLAADTGTLVSSGTLTGGSFTTLIDSAADFVSDGVVAGDRALNDSNVTIGTVTARTDLNTLEIALEMRNPGSGRGSPGTKVVEFSSFAVANTSGDTYRIVRDGGLGASIMHIAGLSSAFLQQSEFVLLNGTNIVVTSKLYATQHRARIFTSGTAGADGDITSTAQSGGTVSAQILGVSGTANQTLMTPYTCPLDKECVIIFWAASLSKNIPTAVADLHLMGGSLAPGATRYVLQTSAVMTTGDSSYPHPYPIPVPIPGGSSVWLAANASANDTGISARMTILIKDR